MKILEDILSSIKGSANARVKDPIMGSFVISWCFCNWDKLAALFLGSSKLEERIAVFSKEMGVITDPSLLKTDLDLLALPLVFTFFYLFALPWISLWVKKLQNDTVISQHSHAVDLDIIRFDKQRELNKAALRADPEKEFLHKEVEMDQRIEEAKVMKAHRENEKLQQESRSIEIEADIKAAQSAKEQIDLESKKRQEEIEKRRFEAQTALHKTTMASARFPAIYQFMSFLSQSLREDDITLSLNGLSNTVAALFGYDNAKEMIDDEEFTNDGIENIKYLYHDPSFLSKRLDKIVVEENSDNDDLSGDLLFDHIQEVLKNYSFNFLSDESLADLISEVINENSDDILNCDELSGPIADTDTLPNYIELEIESFKFDTVFTVSLKGCASGTHRKESDIKGQDISVHITATCSPILGKFGLSDAELKISASPRCYDDEHMLISDTRSLYEGGKDRDYIVHQW